MMLQFIFGPPASGKTYILLQKIKESIAGEKQAVLLVPEQFSFESERLILTALGDSAALMVSVMSFSRLCDEVSRTAGGMTGIPLRDADKVIMMKKALDAAAPELKLWAKYSRSVSFARTMLNTVGELKINAVTPDELYAAADCAAQLSLQNKLRDTALIYKTYNALLGERFIDPADKLTILYRTLEKHTFFKGKTVLIDSFKGFTGQQYQIIDRAMAQADDLFVALTGDCGSRRAYDVFTNIRSAADRIERSAKSFGVRIENPMILEKSRYSSAGLSHLERLMAGGSLPGGPESSGVTLCSAETVEDEARFAARTIRRLVRTGGYRYRDFVIIARDAERYSEAVARACTENDISCFMDFSLPLSSFPVPVAVNAAIRAAERLSSESVLQFHKTGLGTLNPDEISALENYTFLWNITGKRWCEEWTMDPRGMVKEESETGETTKTLASLNAMRERAIEPLIRFQNDFSGGADKLCAAIVHLLLESGAGEKLTAMCEKLRSGEGPFLPDALRQSYDMYMKLLDSLVTCYGTGHLDRKEFVEVLRLAVSLESVGTIPQMLDEVTFGAADRIRPSRPKVAFILGANQGLFPKYRTRAGVFTPNERQSLIEAGLNIADDTVGAAIDENFLIYSSVCCPSERIYISHFRHNAAGEQYEQAAFVGQIKESLNPEIICEPAADFSHGNAPETDLSALGEFCRLYPISKDSAETVHLAAGDRPVYGRIESVVKTLSGEEKCISPDTAKELFGENVYMSASRFDNFHRCRFSFFCRYGLKAQKLQPADFDALQRGTLVHYVLEKLIDSHGKGIAELAAEQIDSEVERFADEYLDSIKGYRSVETARTKFLVAKLTRAVKEVARQIAREFAQSEFEPAYCELKIGGDVVEALEIPFDGGKVTLTGMIDRVDKCGDYLRIVDYKTGSRTFKLPDILFGLNLQMLIYLYAITRTGGVPAGILYMPSKRDLSGSGMAMNGLLPGNMDIITKMERENNGEFVPKLRINKDGGLHGGAASFVPEGTFELIFDRIETLLKDTGETLHSGDIAVSPTNGRDLPACKYCDFGSVCSIEEGQGTDVPEMKNKEIIEALKGEGHHGV